MVASHASIDSSGPQVAGLLVITSETEVVPMDFPMATALTQMSRSVMMPSNFRSLQSFTTGIAPTSLSFISFAACWIPSVGVQQKRFLLIISSTLIRPPVIRAVSRRTDVCILPEEDCNILCYLSRQVSEMPAVTPHSDKGKSSHPHQRKNRSPNVPKTGGIRVIATCCFERNVA